MTYEVAARYGGPAISLRRADRDALHFRPDGLPPRSSWRPSRTPGWPHKRDHGLELRWIFDIPADFGMPAAELTASVALDYDVPGLVGFGFGGSELRLSRSMFRRQFDRARAAGLHSVPHAGETTGPETIWDAVSRCRTDRAWHRRGLRRRRLLEHLVEHTIELDLCLSSNVALRLVPDLDHHPIRELLPPGSPSRSTPTTRRWLARISTANTQLSLVCSISMSAGSPSWH